MEYYILSNNAKQGPFSIQDLNNKSFNANTMVWRIGLDTWMPAYQVEELSEILSNLPPEPPIIKRNLPKTWLVESIIVTCLCCLPFGIMGIINATKVEATYNNKEYDLSIHYSQLAKKWTLLGFFIMLAFGILYLLAIGIFTFITLNG